MSLPELTHLQVFILSSLAEGEHWGKELRQGLESVGHRKSGPAFYQVMARLEDAGLVAGRYETKHVAGQTLKQRKYKITEQGSESLVSALEFYAMRAGTAGIAFT